MMELTDRQAERGVLDQLVVAVRAGQSRTLVIRGEPYVKSNSFNRRIAAKILNALNPS